MTEASIVKILSHWVDERKFPWQLANSFVYDWECDYWAMTSGGTTREFEIKISRADFMVDAKKQKHSNTNGANYFYYVCPENLFTIHEVDKRYGLIYITKEERIKIVRKPTRLHNNGFDKWEILANKMYWKFRALWREKYMEKKITRDEYFEGFNFSLEDETEPITVKPNPFIIAPTPGCLLTASGSNFPSST